MTRFLINRGFQKCKFGWPPKNAEYKSLCLSFNRQRRIYLRGSTLLKGIEHLSLKRITIATRLFLLYFGKGTPRGISPIVWKAALTYTALSVVLSIGYFSSSTFLFNDILLLYTKNHCCYELFNSSINFPNRWMTVSFPSKWIACGNSGPCVSAVVATRIGMNNFLLLLPVSFCVALMAALISPLRKFLTRPAVF